MLAAHRARPVARLAPALAWILLGACQRVPLGDSASAGDQVHDDDNDTDDPGPPPDLTPIYDCEPSGAPACPMGQKCTAVSDGGLQNHFKCVEDDGVLLPLETCTPQPVTGQDQCGAGTVCLAVTSGDLSNGLCFPICRNDSDCELGLCTTSPFSGTTFCADSCDPLVPICPPGLGCRQAHDRFVCEMLTDVDMGTQGANCAAGNHRGCAATYACMPGALVPACASGNCCTTTCDLGQGDAQCSSPALCEPLFPSPAPGFDHVGACFVPA